MAEGFFRHNSADQDKKLDTCLVPQNASGLTVHRPRVFAVDARLSADALPFWGFGERISVGATAMEDVWMNAANLQWYPSDSGSQLTLVSTSANDTAAGTGVQSVQLEYLDSSGVARQENIATNGLTPVNSVAKNIRFVQYMHTRTAGSGGVAAGDITLYQTGTPANVHQHIETGGSFSLTCTRMVPAGYTLYLTDWAASEAHGKSVAVRLRSTNDFLESYAASRIFLFKDTLLLNLASDSRKGVRKIPELCFVKFSVLGISIGARVSASFEGVLVPT